MLKCQFIDLTSVKLFGLCLHFFLSVQTQGRCSSFFPLHMLFAGGRRPQACAPCPHSTSAISRCQAEALFRRCLRAREVRLGAHHPETLTSVSNLAVLLRQQGKMEEAGKMSFGVQRGGLSRGSFNSAFLCTFLFDQDQWPGFCLVSRDCWILSFR